MSPRLRAELVLLLCVAIWSGNFTMTKVALADFTPLAFFALRFTLGSVVTLLVATTRGGIPRFRRADLPLMAAAAVVGVSINQLCFTFGLSETTASNSALLVGTTPIWATALVVLVGLEVVTRRQWALVGTGMAGVAIIVLAGSAGGEGSLLGDLLSLGVAISWGAYTVMVRPLMHRYSATQVSAFMMVVGTAALLPFALPDLLRFDLATVSPAGWAGLLYASLLSVTLTNVLYFGAIHRLGATRAALYGYLEPFLGVLIAVVALGESVLVLQLVGGAIVVASVAADRRRPDEIVPGDPVPVDLPVDLGHDVAADPVTGAGR
jgi:drug/metabolite transporter (DMT)-like permease